MEVISVTILPLPCIQRQLVVIQTHFYCKHHMHQRDAISGIYTQNDPHMTHGCLPPQHAREHTIYM